MGSSYYSLKCLTGEQDTTSPAFDTEAFPVSHVGYVSQREETAWPLALVRH